MLSPRKILIIRLSAIGDVARTLPALRALRARFASAFIAWVVEDNAADLLRGHPDLDRVFVLERSQWKRDIRGLTTFLNPCACIVAIMQQIRREGFDLALDFHGILKSGLISFFSGAPVRAGLSRAYCKEANYLFNNLHVDVGTNDISRVERNLRFLRFLGISPTDPHDPVIPISDGDRRMDGIEVARRIKGDVVLSKTPILMLTALAAVDNKVAGFAAGVEGYMTKPFVLREFSAQAKALIRSSTRERGRNPTTNLPGSSAVEDHIEAVLTEKRDAAVVCFEVRELGAYTDEVGFSRAESLVASLGALLLEQVRALPQEDVFLGHLGGTDFIAVVPREIAVRLVEDVLARFDGSYRDWLVPDTPIKTLTMSAAVVHLDGWCS